MQPYIVLNVISQTFGTTFAGTVATTLSVPDGTNLVRLQVETVDLRYTLDGTTPTTTRGILAPKAQAAYPGEYDFTYTQAVALKMVASSATASINVTNFRAE